MEPTVILQTTPLKQNNVVCCRLDVCKLQPKLPQEASFVNMNIKLTCIKELETISFSDKVVVKANWQKSAFTVNDPPSFSLVSQWKTSSWDHFATFCKKKRTNKSLDPVVRVSRVWNPASLPVLVGS